MFRVGLEQLGLLPQRLLLAVAAVERIEIGEELLGVRLLDLPRRIADDRVEAGLRAREDVGELQLPVEEPPLGRHSPDARHNRLRRLEVVAGQGRRFEIVARPEPERAPEIEGVPEPLVVPVVQQLFVDPLALLGLVDPERVQLLEDAERLVVDVRLAEALRLKGQRLLDVLFAARHLQDALAYLALHLARFDLGDGGGPLVALLRTGPRLAEMVDEAVVVLVAALALPGHDRVVAESDRTSSRPASSRT